jgi:hypothetical protein
MMPTTGINDPASRIAGTLVVMTLAVLSGIVLNIIISLLAWPMVGNRAWDWLKLFRRFDPEWYD